jgi:hypothetical protein
MTDEQHWRVFSGLTGEVEGITRKIVCSGRVSSALPTLSLF